MANTTNNDWNNPFNLPPAVQITLPLSVARNLLTLLRTGDRTWLSPEQVQAVRDEYTNEMIRHGVIRPSEPTLTTPEQQAFTDAAAHMTQEDWDADNAWLESAGWGEM